MSNPYDAFRVLQLNSEWRITRSAKYWYICKRNPHTKWAEREWVQAARVRGTKRLLVCDIQKLGIDLDLLPAALIETMPDGRIDQCSEEARFRAAVAAAAAGTAAA